MASMPGRAQNADLAHMAKSSVDATCAGLAHMAESLPWHHPQDPIGEMRKLCLSVLAFIQQCAN